MLLCIHDSAHFIDKPNPVMVLTGFKSVGEAALLLHCGGEATLVVTPPWDVERAAECVSAMDAVGATDVAQGLEDCFRHYGVPPSRVGVAGLSGMSCKVESRVMSLLQGQARAVDSLVFSQAKRKTDEEIARARVATRIAEQGYERMLQIARPGMREYELACEIRWYMKCLGAEDNFFMLNAGRHNKGVQTSSGRRIEPGDFILAEITPSYLGQMSQICRTAVVGPASNTQREKYALVIQAMKQGIEAAKPGTPMSAVCNAINRPLEAEGYGEYCHPPHIRRRGHGLGFGSTLPGNVAPENDIVLEPDMFFVVHPNQYLPETGYMMCGEPLLITAQGAQPLTQHMASLAEVSV